MKTQDFLIALLLLLISFSTQAQTIDPASEWRTDYSRVEVGSEWYCFNEYYKDFIDGDTILNSKEYYKIYHSGYTYQGWCGYPGSYYYYEHSLHGYLREENDKWYIFYENQDMLMFDFTLETGDTLKGFQAYYCPYDIIVYSVDSIIIDGDYKKRLQLSCGGLINAAYLIEEIGATTGLWAPIYQFEWDEHLVCYARDGISLWGLPTEQCNLAVNINENDEKLLSCSIIPNPAGNFAMVTIPLSMGKVTFTLVDLMGRIVNQQIFESPSTNKIELSPYNSGIYLGIIEVKGLRQAVKLIIE
jgi:hypothetical protein